MRAQFVIISRRHFHKWVSCVSRPTDMEREGTICNYIEKALLFLIQLMRRDTTKQSLDDNIHATPMGECLNTLVKELTAATCVIQSSSNELSTSVSDSIKCKQKESNTCKLNCFFALGVVMAVGLCYQTDLMLVAFWARRGASRMSSYTDEWWYKETVCLCMTIYNLDFFLFDPKGRNKSI